MKGSSLPDRMGQGKHEGRLLPACMQTASFCGAHTRNIMLSALLHVGTAEDSFNEESDKLSD